MSTNNRLAVANLLQKRVETSLLALLNHLKTDCRRGDWLDRALQLQTDVNSAIRSIESKGFEFEADDRTTKALESFWRKFVEVSCQRELDTKPTKYMKLACYSDTGLSIDLRQLSATEEGLEALLSKTPESVQHTRTSDTLVLSNIQNTPLMWTTEHFRLAISDLGKGNTPYSSGGNEWVPRMALELVVKENAVCVAWLNEDQRSYHVIMRRPEHVELLLYQKLPDMASHFGLAYSYSLWDSEKLRLLLLLPRKEREYAIDADGVRYFQRDLSTLLKFYCKSDAEASYGPLTLQLLEKPAENNRPSDLSQEEPLYAFQAAIYAKDQVLFRLTLDRFLKMLDHDLVDIIYQTRLPYALVAHVEEEILAALEDEPLLGDVPNLNAITEAIFSDSGIESRPEISTYFPTCPSAKWYVPLVAHREARFTILSRPGDGVGSQFCHAYAQVCDAWGIDARVLGQDINDGIKDKLVIARCLAADQFMPKILDCLNKGGKVLTTEPNLDTFENLRRSKIAGYFLYQNQNFGTSD